MRRILHGRRLSFLFSGIFSLGILAVQSNERCDKGIRELTILTGHDNIQKIEGAVTLGITDQHQKIMGISKNRSWVERCGS